jgi:UDPglucose 6-dehydrogenase
LRLSIVGCGHVGLVAGGCLACLGNRVTLIDRDVELLKLLQEDKLPFYEPHLETLVAQYRKAGLLQFTSSMGEGIRNAEAIFLCVGVPTLDTGESDFSALDAAVREIAREATASSLIVIRSTVPVQTGAQVKHTLGVYNANRELRFAVASNPQFLREGRAVEGFLHPDRVLLGVEDKESEAKLRQIYEPILKRSFSCPVHSGGCPAGAPPELLITSIQSAELIKNTSNAFLAVKISYANVLADLCEQLGADVQEVTHAIGMDTRIKPDFFQAGIGFGGTRLPQDLRALCRLTEQSGVESGILRAAEEVNRDRVSAFFAKVERWLWVVKGKRIGMLGLAHKGGTNDVRNSPAVQLCQRFLAAGARVSVFDPQSMLQAHSALPETVCCKDPYEAAKGADALVIAADWEEFRALDWKAIREMMSRPAIFDGRNVLSPGEMKALGFEYYSVGRPG